ncbi:MAG: acylneuraminate cytidylyltransferase family protein [Ferruginibacter sp.]|nr:acylneuraminate cytidylyltransferase family protein [Ferruginibacter sp.]
MKILGIIPAREGSKRVVSKNFKPFANTTLTDLTISHALKSNLLSTTVVTSDSLEVLKIAAKYPEVKCIRRPDIISGDLAPAIDYVRHCLSVVEPADGPFDMVVILQPSSPLRKSSDIDATIELLMEHPDADSAVSIVQVSHMLNPLKLKTLQNNVLLPYMEDEKGRFAKEDLPDIFVRNCAVYASWRKDLEIKNDVIGSTSVGFEMPFERSVDINDPIDFEFAEYLYKKSIGPIA